MQVETEEEGSDGPLPLTLENVEKTLDEMRPYLMADGGNVRVSLVTIGVCCVLAMFRDAGASCAIPPPSRDKFLRFLSLHRSRYLIS
jgi:hypothetical protein